MAELEVDQSNLPRVQEVCQCFAVLEDGALAHNLQEQESKIYNSLISSTTLEQYYTSNVQRNQLVQKDIRVAKRLQDEEKHTAQLLQQQATQQLEERDSEYAQMIQEEIQRCAEETRRREVEDEEIAKRIQKEELCVRHRGSYQNRDDQETSSVPVPPYSPRAVHTPENRYHNRSSTRRRQHSPSPPYYSDSEEDLIEHRRPTVVTSRSHTYQNGKSSVGQSYSRPSRSHVDQDNRSTISGSTVSQKSRTSHLSGGWGDVIKLIKNDLSEQGYLSHSSEDELFEPVYKLERLLKQKQQASDSQGNRDTRLSRRSSVREDCSHEERDRGRHVHFLDDRRCVNALNSLNENGHIDTRERNEVVDSLSSGMPRDNHTHTRESHSDRRQTQASQSFRRNISMRRSYHSDARLSRRTSVRGRSRTCSQDDSSFVNRVRPLNSAQMEERQPGPLRWEADRHQRQRARSLTEREQMIDRRYPGQHRHTRYQSERWQSLEEERSSTEEERESRREVRGREERLSSRSTCQSYSGHAPRAGHGGRSGMAALDLGELEQVLLDEEMARRLQEEEERLAGGTQQSSSLKGMCPGDFRMAQVAQDEEIARFIQKQEIKAKRRSGELDANGSGREYRDMVTEYDRRGVCDRQLQRERMGSDGLQSPVDDFITELSSPVSMAAEPQLTRNIAEDLDPTFQRKEMADAGLRINGASQGSQQISLHNPIEEQSNFVPPTKRQNDKLGRGKTKDKKENMKQKENCKQQ